MVLIVVYTKHRWCPKYVNRVVADIFSGTAEHFSHVPNFGFKHLNDSKQVGPADFFRIMR